MIQYCFTTGIEAAAQLRLHGLDGLANEIEADAFNSITATAGAAQPVHELDNSVSSGGWLVGKGGGWL